MTETLTLGVDTDRDSVIGDRQLVAVQTFFVSRLTSHPVVLVPGTFIAVTGRGPRGDSNGSGKTSFLAAVSLLLGDCEWRLAGGAKAPTALLFDARAAGGAVGTTASASHRLHRGPVHTTESPLRRRPHRLASNRHSTALRNRTLDGRQCTGGRIVRP
ncbi:MAG: hypothetical protein M5T61_19920 [Acidimicrobiia bacterium]|nr:hypothetical protein [Acidimicrobiia bacterium]